MRAPHWADTDTANTPHAVAAREGEFYVRAALDPAYATEAALDGMVRMILTGEGADDRMLLLSTESRATVAATAVRGWVCGRLEARCVCAFRSWSARCPVDRHRAYAAALVQA